MNDDYLPMGSRLILSEMLEASWEVEMAPECIGLLRVKQLTVGKPGLCKSISYFYLLSLSPGHFLLDKDKESWHSCVIAKKGLNGKIVQTKLTAVEQNTTIHTCAEIRQRVGQRDFLQIALRS